MLFFSLCCSVFVSLMWLIFSLRFVADTLNGMSFFDAGILNMLLYVLIVCLPLFLLWLMFSFISQYFYNRTALRQMHRLFSQMKKNQEYSDLLARIMLETEQNIKSSNILNRFDVLIADMNELLSEIILKERLVSQEQVEYLWGKVQNGGRWSFGKVIIENYNRQPFFQKKIFADASSDNLLAGTIMEFCARYQMLLSLLEKYDREKTFLNIIETGVFGKVYSVFAPVSDEIRRSREVSFAENKRAFDVAEDTFVAEKNIVEQEPAYSEPKEPKKNIKKAFGFLGKSKKENDVKQSEKDAFSLALERSFSDNTVLPAREEPVFELSPEPLNSQNNTEKAETVEEAEETIVKVPEDVSDEKNISEINISDTQKALNGLKKEWQDMKTDNDGESEEDFAYPFGGWIDANKYQK